MIDLLNSLSRALPLLGEMSLTAAYVAAVVAVLRLILKKRAPKQVLCLLWLVVFARLLIPANLESPLSILPDQEQVQAIQDLPAMLMQTALVENPGQNPAQGQNPAHNQDKTGGTAAGPVSQGNVKPDAPALSLPDGTPPSAPRDQPQAGFPWRALLAGVWLAGALVMGLYGLGSYLGLKRRLFDAIRSQDGAWEHPAVRSPFILGIIRPKIYLPAGLGGQSRQFILCHERAHLRRLDHIVKPLCWTALAIHWFNPAVWAAFLLMSRDIEAACDEAVIRRLGPKVKADYSATLLALATGGRMPAPCPLAFDEGNAKGRIQNVLRYRRPTLWIVVVSVIMAIMAAVCLLTDPVSAQEPYKNPDPSASQSQAPEGDGVLDPWMVEVLNGERSFSAVRSQEDSRTYTIHDLKSFFYGDDQNYSARVELGKLAVIDLDKDGVNELVVWPEGDDEYLYSVVGYAILRRQGDEVYGYNPVYRAFGLLKSDGTFHWSNSSFNWGTGSARFTNDGFEVEDITWCEIHSEADKRYFVDGLKATREEFEAATAAQDAKPDPVWYVFEDGQILKADQLSSIPANVDDLGLSLPGFLDNEQQILYCNALITYSHLFGTSSELVNPNSYGTTEPVEYNGRYYYPDTGVYGSWEEFEGTVLSTFTENFWNTRNKDQLYVNINGIMHYLDWARGGGGYNENFPETFRLVERTDDAIEFIMPGYYSELHPVEGESDEDRDARLKAGWEYSIEYPMRMVRTDRGWRFDEFHNAGTDNGIAPFCDQHIPNPDMPSPPTSPEPSATPEPVVVSELDGMRLLSTADGFQLTWQGQSFPVGPDISYNGRPWLEDFDEDGQPEALFPGHADGSYPFTIYDFVDNALVGHSLPDIASTVYPAISANSVAGYNPANGGLTVTYSWGEDDNRHYISASTTLPRDFFAGCEELADGRPLRIEVTPGSLNGVPGPRSLFYRAKVTLTDGITTSPEVGYMYCGFRYSDSGFEIREPDPINFDRDIRA